MFKTKFTSSNASFSPGVSESSNTVNPGFNDLQVLKGEDGFSPIVEVTQATDGYILTITDKEGSQSLYIENGKDGEKGEKGDQGVAGPEGPEGPIGLTGPTGATGQTGATGPQGPQGPAGAQGPQGPAGQSGKDGQDGRTPIKGIDYFTEAEKEQIVSEVIERLPESDEPTDDIYYLDLNDLEKIDDDRLKLPDDFIEFFERFTDSSRANLKILDGINGWCDAIINIYTEEILRVCRRDITALDIFEGSNSSILLFDIEHSKADGWYVCNINRGLVVSEALINTIEQGIESELSDNYYNKNEIDNKITDILTNEQKKYCVVTYEELKALCNTGKLIPGTFYRITDYTCTTTQYDTYATDHKFDIVVQALSKNTLSENASADYHYDEEGHIDGYFGIAKYNFALEVLYNIIEDETGESNNLETYKPEDVFIEYGYEDNIDGETVPVLYKTDVEYFPDEPDYGDVFYYMGAYEFDGVIYDRWRKIDEDLYTWDNPSKKYVLTAVIIKDGDFDQEALNNHTRTQITKIANLNAWKLKYCIDNDINRFAWADPIDGKGVIYHMIDEYENECPYDFKNILFDREVDGEYYQLYTFSFINKDNDEVFDLSMLPNNVRNNRIDRCDRKLNNIVFISTSAEDVIEYQDYWHNIFDVRCCDITVMDSCDDNKFGEGCKDISLGMYCTGNTFKSNCRNDTLGNHCCYNTFENICSDNTLEHNCEYNHFDSNCVDNNLGQNCSYNNFGMACSNNNLKQESNCNTFGANCKDITFYGNCEYNIFNKNCYSITLYSKSCYNIFGIACNRIGVQDSIGDTAGLLNSKIGDNCYNLQLRSAYASWISGYVIIDSIVIGRGVHGETTGKARFISNIVDFTTYEAPDRRLVILD